MSVARKQHVSRPSCGGRTPCVIDSCWVDRRPGQGLSSQRSSRKNRRSTAQPSGGGGGSCSIGRTPPDGRRAWVGRTPSTASAADPAATPGRHPSTRGCRRASYTVATIGSNGAARQGHGPLSRPGDVGRGPPPAPPQRLGGLAELREPEGHVAAVAAGDLYLSGAEHADAAVAIPLRLSGYALVAMLNPGP
jgi:hypothetical protein